jgi:hypothetical protein
MSQINSKKGGLNIDRYIIILLLDGGDSSGDESAQGNNR